MHIPHAASSPGAGPSTRSRRGSPMDTQNQNSSSRPLNVTDALSYLDAVKGQFQHQSDVYNKFLDIMKEFKNEQIDTPGVIQRVSELFNGHPNLIQGFNTFLPAGYRIECSSDSYSSSIITVFTPTGARMHGRNSPGSTLQWISEPADSIPTPYPQSPEPRHFAASDGQAIEPAVQYVQKIKQRCDPDTYRQFLDILSRYHHSPESIDEDDVSKQIAALFKDAPDLRADFRVFMPDRHQPLMDDVPSSARDKDKNRRKLDVVANSVGNANTSLPLKRKRRPAEKEREREKELPPSKIAPPPAKKPKHSTPQDFPPPQQYSSKQPIAGPSSPRRVAHQLPPQHPHQPQHVPPPPPRMTLSNDETQFFDRVKRVLDNRDLYNEFLKLVNLFAQDFIDTARLVKESRHFLGNTELYKQFCDILGWDEKKEREYFLAEQYNQTNWTKPAIARLSERPGRIDLSEKYGSYRKVSFNEANVPCSGRDEMCRSVLNDEWVSHPTWTSEDSGFISHKKNIFEEALHRSEEERHEYDFHIDAIVRTIAMLEPINNKIQMLPPDERPNYKLKPNLSGSWKPIHSRIVKKIYGREAGLEVIQSMQDTPAAAIPVVLSRMKQKEEEWKRGQRAWNKTWREVDAANFAKSLDHQAITFKATDKKSLTMKALVGQIETAREEQRVKRAALIDPLLSRTRARHQLEFSVGNERVLQDSIKLIFSFLDRTQGQLNATDRRRIEVFLRTFIPLFFTLDPVAFNSVFIVHDTIEGEMSDIDINNAGLLGPDSDDHTSSAPSRGRNGRKHHPNVSSGGDLRKKLLKSEQAKSTSRKTRAQEAAAASPAVSRFASPALAEDDAANKAEGSSAAATGSLHSVMVGAHKRSSKINNAFYTNTTFYVLLRLLEVLYSRLELFYNLGQKLAANRPSQRKPTKNAKEAALIANHGVDLTHQNGNYYEMLLVSCERLFENDIEQVVFEDLMRSVFGIKDAYNIFTIDKVIGTIIKQVQAVIVDPKSQELLEHLKRERSLAAPTTQDRINHRRNVEKVLGPDENAFRIDWLSDSKTMTIQLIGKDDSNYDDSEVLTGRWQSYIDAYVSGENTDGVPQIRVRRPFLRKNLPPSVRETVPDTASQDGLEIKVCLRTYRLFYVSRTEDFMWRYRTKDEVDSISKQLKARNELRRKWLETAKASAP
ncbi:hypothetical protein BJ165DRAFT_1349868 [Panaeolus papilionaceus]|nr:hypothetical protein BJ165DRAFT_1349868 [Panaeolus papilionaceus]